MIFVLLLGWLPFATADTQDAIDPKSVYEMIRLGRTDDLPVEWLQENNFEINDMPVLLIAENGGQFDTFKYLLEQGVSPHASYTSSYGYSPLLTLVDGKYAIHLIRLGADVESTDYRGNFPLQIVLHKKTLLADDIELIRTLIEYGANVNRRSNNTGSTALHWAARKSNELYEYFLSVGANERLKNDNGRTPKQSLAIAQRVKARNQ